MKKKILAVIPAPKEAPHIMSFARRQVEQLAQIGLEIEVFYFENRRLGQLLNERKKLKTVIKDFSPDVIHAHYGTLTLLLCTISASLIPIIVTFRGSDINFDRGVSFFRRVLGVCISQVCHLFVKKSVCVALVLKDQLWFKKDNSEVIPDGINMEIFRPTDAQVSRKILNLDENKKIILFNVGNYPITKGLELAEKSVSLISKKRDDVYFLKLTGNIPANHIPDYLNASDCILMTSLTEGSPVIIKEAMACNLPVVSVDVGDVKEMIEDVDNCYITNRDQDDIAEKVLKVLESNKKSNGREYSNRYSSTVMNEKMKNLILSIEYQYNQEH